MELSTNTARIERRCGICGDGIVVERGSEHSYDSLLAEVRKEVGRWERAHKAMHRPEDYRRSRA